ncbi:DNA-binding response regulator (plasmid) [Aquabacterium olei]|uniref:DNA-binding response regulator n=1 Tax=Aquabacterium olei TaxID=1296669 RepID=A0A2U8FWT4_9BURK|nr:response regulator transcription factor [Aquabacterium olei]AWI55522.1 DNA-binding response regulator [Aquabacterium olei]
MPIRLLVVDDHTLFRRGLIALLGQFSELEIVAEAGDAGEALRHIQTHQPDVVLLDNHLPGVHGIDALPQLLAHQPAPRVLMLTVSEDADDLATALSRGASGYLLKTVEGDDLVDAIRRVHRGESAVSPEMTGKLVAAYRQAVQQSPQSPGVAAEAPPPAATPTAADRATEATPHPLAKLSPRERDILREIARGASNKEIGRKLDIAETTVKIHVQHILRKLNLTSRVQAAVLASSDPDQT